MRGGLRLEVGVPLGVTHRPASCHQPVDKVGPAPLRRAERNGLRRSGGSSGYLDTFQPGASDLLCVFGVVIEMLVKGNPVDQLTRCTSKL